MAETKTRATTVEAADFIAAVSDPVRRADAEVLSALMTRITGEPATMWGPTIVGFGRYAYRYDSGHSGESCRTGFSPRKAELVLYVLSGDAAEAALLAKLGKHRTGKRCLYIKRLDSIDMAVLEQLIAACWARMATVYPA